MKKTYILIIITCLTILISSPAFSTTYVEDFADPLGNWTSDWLYLNTNLENYYVANNYSDCDPNYRGNQPYGIWISENRGCGNAVDQSPVTINFLNHFGDTATSFSIDIFTCREGIILNIYDKNGALDTSVPLPTACWTFSNYSFNLTNGISAFEFAGEGIEGNTSIDNVTLIMGGSVPVSIPTMNEWGMIIFMALAGLAAMYSLRKKNITR